MIKRVTYIVIDRKTSGFGVIEFMVTAIGDLPFMHHLRIEGCLDGFFHQDWERELHVSYIGNVVHRPTLQWSHRQPISDNFYTGTRLP